MVVEIIGVCIAASSFVRFIGTHYDSNCANTQTSCKLAWSGRKPVVTVRAKSGREFWNVQNSRPDLKIKMFKILVKEKFSERVVNYVPTVRELCANCSWTRRDNAESV